jgi:hypothetical protein
MPDRPPGRKRNGPHASTGRRQPPQTTTATITRSGDAAGDLAAWGAAVEHLHAVGLPAAVPAFAAAWLRRRGIRPDWMAAA